MTEIVKRTLSDKRRGKTDFAAQKAKTDAQIDAEISTNPDAAPILDDEWFKSATLQKPGSR